MSRKRRLGQFYTKRQVFNHPAFLEWAAKAGLPNEQVLEPFAGANHIIRHLKALNLIGGGGFASYDIHPAKDAKDITQRDTLQDFPQGFKVCVTNPPWLARNSAKRYNYPFPDKSVMRHDDLYLWALDLALRHCEFVAAVVPENFIRQKVLRARLRHFVSIQGTINEETDAPVGLALFHPKRQHTTQLWLADNEVGTLREVEGLAPPLSKSPLIGVKFHATVGGNVGLKACDTTERGGSIRFMEPQEFLPLRRASSQHDLGRYYSLMKVSNCEISIDEWNQRLAEIRTKSADLLLSPYLGTRKDGMLRRRLSWDLARRIINAGHALPFAT